MKQHPLKQIVTLQKNNQAVGIYSACTANPFVIEACLLKAKDTNSLVLIEATANQVDQYGGYTGMKPKDFARFVYEIADKVNVPHQQIILGGDHLGPLTFTEYGEEEAMKKASELIRQYVLAGFSKIHIDTSMKIKGDDPNIPLSDEIIARRGATLAQVAEESLTIYAKENPDAYDLVYVIGSEVPIPGGAQDAVETDIQVTKVSDFEKTVKTFKNAFSKESFEKVIAIVVQPGVEEKDAGCTEYDRLKATDLMDAIKNYQQIVYEGHSTDYQTKIHLRELVEDGVGILKVGPGLTFALREALFALAFIEAEYFKNTPIQTSQFIETLDEAMKQNPKYYQKYYHGTSAEIDLKRKYSFSDRCRYYLPLPEVQASIQTLINNLKDGIPLNLLSQFMPIQYTKVREGIIANKPVALIIDRIQNTVDEYLYASHQEKLKF